MSKFLKAGSALVLAMGLGIGSAQAENSLKAGTLSLNVPVNDTLMDGDVNSMMGNMPFMIGGKYMLGGDMAVTGGFGLGIQGGDGEGSDLAFKVGVRKYSRVADFAPFMGAGMLYANYMDGNVTDFGLIGEFGAEYFFNRQFSIEGAARVGYISHEVDSPIPGGAGADNNVIGTLGAGVSVNYYF